jgi:hypothetical protein
MRTLVWIAAVIVACALAAPALAGLSPVQRIILQEQARRNDPRLYSPGGSPPVTALSPVQRIIAQENATLGYPRISTHATLPTTASVRLIGSNGFDWGDAGIGAAAGIGLIAIATGALLVIRNGRPQAAQLPAGSKGGN